MDIVFINLTGIDGDKILINVRDIVYVRETADKEGCYIKIANTSTSISNPITVKDAYNKIFSKISESYNII